MSTLSELKILFAVTFFTIFISCKKEVVFTSNFETTQKRTWIGPEYWANPMQDWQVNKGELECLVSGGNRNVHLLTKRLGNAEGNLIMKVSFKLLATEVSNKNWVGFCIGSKGAFNDYRDNAVFGKGLNVGVTTSGSLFIEDLPEDENSNEFIKKQFSNNLSLEIIVDYKNGYKLKITLFNEDTNTEIAQLSKENIDGDKLDGDLVLVSNFAPKGKQSGRSNRKLNENASVRFKNWTVKGTKVKTTDEFSFGPILFSQYTLSKNILKLTAQMAPVIIKDEKVKFQIKENGNWKTINEVDIDKSARTATFRIENWKTKKDIPYRIAYKIDKGKQAKEELYWEGTIRKDPLDEDDVVIAGFTGNSDLGFPNTDIVNQVKYQNPDVLFFSGDQIYEPVGGYGTQRKPLEKSKLDYLRKWYIFGWAYKDIMKDRPTVIITDDHDVYHGNIWGEGGKHSPTENFSGGEGQDAGGYMMPVEWVKMVERTQTSHLPDPYNKTPIKQGLTTYYTDMVYGGISFAVLEDRKFKSAPRQYIPEANIVNGWPLNKDFNMAKDGDVLGVKLLGDKQLSFLDQWATDWSHQSEMKVLLSQTIFANVATLPSEELSGKVISRLKILPKGEYPPNDRPVADLDSNGWPQTGRNNAVKTIRKGFAFHLAGDQHLGSTIQYGVDEWNDGGFALCVPSISNYWPRRWYPSFEGLNRDPEKPRYTGDYQDGFGNKMTVHAISNPTFTGKEPSRLYDRAAGYGIVRLNKKERTLILECWPRGANPKLGDSEQYEGWPIQISQELNYGRKAASYLPALIIKGLEKPVVQIINDSTKEIEYSIRLNRYTFKPKVFDASTTYTIKVGEPDTNTWKIEKNIVPSNDEISFEF